MFSFERWILDKYNATRLYNEKQCEEVYNKSLSLSYLLRPKIIMPRSENLGRHTLGILVRCINIFMCKSLVLQCAECAG